MPTPPDPVSATPSGTPLRRLLLKPDLFLAVNGFLILLGPVLLSPVLDADTRLIRRLAGDPIETRARVVRITRNQLHKPHRVDYEYILPDGRLFQNRDEMFLELTDASQIPTFLPVVYSASEPELSMSLERYEGRRLGRIPHVTGALAAVLGLFVLFRWQRRERLGRDGTRVRAVVAGIDWLIPGPPMGVVRVRYILPDLPEAPVHGELFTPFECVSRLRAGDELVARVCPLGRAGSQLVV